jgi:hypothetical protein
MLKHTEIGKFFTTRVSEEFLYRGIRGKP